MPFNYFKAVAFMFPLGCVLVYGLYVSYKARQYFHIGLPDSQVVKRRALTIAIVDVVVFNSFWTVAGLNYIIYLYGFDPEDKGSNPYILFYGTWFGIKSFLFEPMMFFSSIGLFHFCCDEGGCQINFSEATETDGVRESSDEFLNEAQKDGLKFDLLSPTMKQSLLREQARRDIIAATALGITEGVTMAQVKWDERACAKAAPAEGADTPCDDPFTVKDMLPADFNKEPQRITIESRQKAGNMGEWTSATFEDYCPLGFAGLRELAGLSRDEYVHSVNGGDLATPGAGYDPGSEALDPSQRVLNGITSLKEQGSEGKSGSFFYFTADKRFMIKTVTAQEHRQVLDMLPQLCAHMVTNKGTLLNQIYGAHGVRLHEREEVTFFIVMESVSWTSNPFSHRFDIKGSWVDRASYKKAKGQAQLQEEVAQGKVRTCMKDSDLESLGFRVYITPEEREFIIAQIAKDTAFLRQFNIMDYSLLLAAHSRPLSAAAKHKEHSKGDVPKHRQTENGLRRVLRKGDDASVRTIYYFGVIDILQLYDCSKVGESFLKSKLLCKDVHGISSVPAEEYHTRFNKRMDEIFVAVPDEEAIVDPTSNELQSTSSVEADYQAAMAAAASYQDMAATASYQESVRDQYETRIEVQELQAYPSAGRMTSIEKRLLNNTNITTIADFDKQTGLPPSPHAN